MPVLHINNSQETFTPTQSGAIATIIWESCQAAAAQGKRPLVISRRCAAEPYPWDGAHFLDYPRIGNGRVVRFVVRLDRRLTGWLHLGQRQYAQRVVGVIRSLGLGHMPMVLHNDPELACTVKEQFPATRVIHLFHSFHPCKERFRSQLARVDVIAAVSDYTSRWAEQYYALAAGSVQTLYPGVDTTRFSPAAPKPANVPVIGYVGRTGCEKAPDLLLRACTRLADVGKKFEVQVVGSNRFDGYEPTKYARELEGLVRGLQMRGIGVRWPGHIGRAKLPAEFQKADIHVVPSRCDEAFGLTTVEGMACGLAVVASRVGGTPEVVGDAGLMFERDSVDGLFRHLDALVSDPNLRRELQLRARARALTFSWGRCWQRTRELAGL